METSVRPRSFTVDEYYAMAEAGLFREKDRVELIEGQIMMLLPIGSRHATVVSRLTMKLVPVLDGRAIVNVQNPVRLGDHSEPEPDLAVVRLGPDYMKRHPGPEDVHLIIEVSDATLHYDLYTKLPLYARFGIPEVWIVDLRAPRVVVCREPSDAGYEVKEEYRAGQTIEMIAFADVAVDLDTLFEGVED